MKRAAAPAHSANLAATVERIGTDWLAAAEAMRSLDAAFASRLSECRDGSAAAMLCAEWMGHRLDSLVAAQHRLIEAWAQAAAAGGVGSTAPARATAGKAAAMKPGDAQC